MHPSKQTFDHLTCMGWFPDEPSRGSLRCLLFASNCRIPARLQWKRQRQRRLRRKPPRKLPQKKQRQRRQKQRCPCSFTTLWLLDLEFCEVLSILFYGVMLTISATGIASNLFEDTCVCPTFRCFVSRGK